MTSITETAVYVWNIHDGKLAISQQSLMSMSHEVAYLFRDGHTSPDKIQMLAHMILSDLADSQSGNTGTFRERSLGGYIKKPELHLPDVEDTITL